MRLLFGLFIPRCLKKKGVSPPPPPPPPQLPNVLCCLIKISVLFNLMFVRNHTKGVYLRAHDDIVQIFTCLG